MVDVKIVKAEYIVATQPDRQFLNDAAADVLHEGSIYVNQIQFDAKSQSHAPQYDDVVCLLIRKSHKQVLRLVGVEGVLVTIIVWRCPLTPRESWRRRYGFNLHLYWLEDMVMQLYMRREVGTSLIHTMVDVDFNNPMCTPEGDFNEDTPLINPGRGTEDVPLIDPGRDVFLINHGGASQSARLLQGTMDAYYNALAKAGFIRELGCDPTIFEVEEHGRLWLKDYPEIVS